MRRRLWIRESDGLVSRAVESWGDQVHREATLKSASLNLPRTQMDLDHVAPASDRYSLAQRPWQFTVGLAGLAFGSGFFVWFCATAVAITKGRGVRPARWPRIWKWYSVAAGFAAAGLGLLALLSLPGGGHPPPIVFVMIFAIFAALGFLALAMFLLGGQLGRSIAVRRFSSAPSAPPA